MDAPLVLVVDDDDDIRTMLGWVLEANGYRVACAADGDAALEWLRTHDPPRLALVDLMMPKIDGDDLVREIRRLPGFAGLPIVIVSGHGAAAESARAAGAVGWLAKPVELDELLETVARFVEPVPV